ncbi:hypothetical protein VTK73DRAFT_3267 [Phialemonium thermophilum]|uniref:DNA repair protein REV1 n=1 Tax=Phialemonium thermophilum TaxID=223376 RepID=A0ABR3Y893_9PEZI
MGSRLEKNSTAVRKRIENHAFYDEFGEEYEASEFGGFGDYFRRKKIKLQNLDADLRSSAGDKPQIFRGVVAHVMGYTQPSLHVLHKELVQHGAGFLQYLDSKTMATHIIASALPPKKAVDFSRYRIVKPAWVMDSIQAGRVLPWANYRVTEESPRQKTIKFDGAMILTQASRSSELRYREQTKDSYYTSQFQKASDPTYQASPRGSPSVEKSLETTPKGMGDAIDDSDFMDVDQLATIGTTTVPNVQTPTETAYSDRSEPEAQPSGVAMNHWNPDDEGGDDGESPGSPSLVPQPILAKLSKPKEAMTPEQHNAMLLSDPRIRKSSTANPEFLKQFYSESRLHHLSTWKAELKSRMQKLTVEKGPASKNIKRRPGSRRYIMHVDFDSFFCAVSLKKYPQYADKPSVVAHSTGNGSEIASCNYPARKFGIKNGMWMKRAQELCSDLKILPYDFPAYEEASRLFYDSILEIGGVTQSVSIDEALVDITSIVLSATGSVGMGVNEGSVWREQEKANQIAADLRQKVKHRTGCNVSIGIGGNILLAKVALRKAKPAGQHQILPEDVLDVLADLKVEDLPGVAYSIGGKLEEIGVKLVRDIRQTSKERLISVLGPKTGEKLWDYSRGIDRAEVGEQTIRKSVSAEVNWGIRFINQQEAEDFVVNLCKELERRLLNEGVRGRHLTVKIMKRSADAPLDPPKHLGHGKCDVFNKSAIFGVATNNAETIGKEAVAILRYFKFSPGDLRGLGVQLTRLEPIKAKSVAAPEGSQKRLSFPAFAASPSVKKQMAEAIEDGENPNESRTAARGDADPITDDPLTPRKPKVHPALALAKAGEADENARTLLNMTGTQFIMPSNPDPTVVAELPWDIRSKLTGKSRSKATFGVREQSPISRSVTESPAADDTPPPDVDPEVFNALPDDVKAEILATYRARKGQGLLPQSPRKERVIQQPKKKATPTKRGIRTLFNRGRERLQGGEGRLQQTNFLTGSNASEGSSAGAAGGGGDVDELDPEFLSELPEDVRKEVIEDHRRQRLALKSGLNLQAQPRRVAVPTTADGLDGVYGGGQMKLQFPARPPKVSFTSSSLTSVTEIKDMLVAWHRETQEDGPHEADVEIFEKYLAKVVLDERDMEKTRNLMTWLEWVVEEDNREDKGKQGWRKALASVKAAIQEAMKSRGLGPMECG